MADAVPQVISEIVSGDALTLAQAAKLIPSHRGSGNSTKSRISRWASAGYKRTDGAVVKLEVAKFGAQLLTSKAALQRFVAALNTDGAPAAAGAPPARTPSDRLKAADAATRRLAKAGA